jgi:DNA-directed RNA polymerase subunit RPC12/RpoP
MRFDPHSLCPDCKSNKIVKIRFTGEVKAYPYDKVLSLGSYLVGKVCTDCGLIIQLKLEKPEKFRGK